ncbi:response regulator [Reyranella sp. CPCC 100927]|uniref:response regulator n=1 Tax=Reyranella sp. CPCC 100927 TaxID=2599616 RepID=UPI0011B45C88|nr:response regulator [Reyranella sp. CPCC 100927]TWT13801.1 response regulator [Reyranella sp. CPCC 100927]
MVAPTTPAPRILVVEDEVLVRMTLTDTLEDFGFTVEPVGSASEAMDKVADLRGRIDAAILDVGLPDRTGDALAVDLRALYADLPIVIATGYEDGELRERFKGDRLVTFFAKPYNSAEVVPVLRSLGVRDPRNRTGLI